MKGPPAGTSQVSKRSTETCAARATGSWFMIADAVRYMSVHSWTQWDSHGLSGTSSGQKHQARETGKIQLTGYFRRWWQVLGSNQRRLSRRFYSEPIPTHRNTH